MPQHRVYGNQLRVPAPYMALGTQNTQITQTLRSQGKQP
jgi:hypothetical protein